MIINARTGSVGEITIREKDAYVLVYIASDDLSRLIINELKKPNREIQIEIPDEAPKK